jgi:hypothetical protein
MDLDIHIISRYLVKAIYKKAKTSYILEEREYCVCSKRVTNVYQGEEVTAASKYRVNPQPHDHLSKHAKEVGTISNQ